jgi:hypothetical protein
MTPSRQPEWVEGLPMCAPSSCPSLGVCEFSGARKGCWPVMVQAFNGVKASLESLSSYLHRLQTNDPRENESLASERTERSPSPMEPNK